VPATKSLSLQKKKKGNQRRNTGLKGRIFLIVSKARNRGLARVVKRSGRARAGVGAARQESRSLGEGRSILKQSPKSLIARKDAIPRETTDEIGQKGGSVGHSANRRLKVGKSRASKIKSIAIETYD